jgi:hypothetical protein
MALPNSITSEHPVGGGGSPYYIGGPGGLIGFFQDPYGAIFTGTISTTTLTVLSLTQGTIVVGQTITSGAAAGTTITGMGTATAQSGAGALGTWTISTSQTVSAVTTFTSGLGAVAQPSSPGTQQNYLYTSAAPSGTITLYSPSPAVNSFLASTTTEQTSSVTTQVSTTSTFATSSVIFFNKPALQAGLGIAGSRVNTAGQFANTWLNVSTGALTPTQEMSSVVEIKAGPIVTTATLTPATVQVNTTSEQIFTITGNVCLPGTVAIVNKPTAQTGLGYSVFARVVGVNQVAVQFAGTSTAVSTNVITPTAAEAYQFAFIPQLNAFNPTLIYGIPAPQGALTASSTVEITSSVNGILLTDTVAGVSKPTVQASSGVVGARVSALNVISLAMGQWAGASAVTATSSEVYLATVIRQAPLNPVMIYNSLLAATTCAATTSIEATTTVTGLVVSSAVAVNKPTLTAGILVTGARVSAANTLAVTYTNLTGASINVPAETYAIANVQLQTASSGVTSTAGLFVSQTYYPALQQSMVLANALRSALVGMNLIQGT